MRIPKNKEKIVEASLNLFCDKGFSKTSIKDITENAGVSMGNVYNYFKNKEEIFDHLFERYFPGNYVEMFMEGFSDERSFDETIDLIMTKIMGFANEHERFFKLVAIDANEFSGDYLRKYTTQFIEPIQASVEGSFDKLEIREDIDLPSFIQFFSWLFYSVGLTDIIYKNNTGAGLEQTAEYKVLLMILKQGLKNMK